MLAGFYGRVPRTPDAGVDQVPVAKPQRLLSLYSMLKRPCIQGLAAKFWTVINIDTLR